MLAVAEKAAYCARAVPGSLLFPSRNTMIRLLFHLGRRFAGSRSLMLRRRPSYLNVVRNGQWSPQPWRTA